MRRAGLEERIRELCVRMGSAKEPEFSIIVEELRNALHDHNKRLRRMAAEQMTAGKPVEKKPQKE